MDFVKPPAALLDEDDILPDLASEQEPPKVYEPLRKADSIRTQSGREDALLQLDEFLSSKGSLIGKV